MTSRFTLSVLALACAASTQAATFSATYFFGDSLSDSGAFQGLVPVGGRFTTNPDVVWAELLADRYGASAGAVNPNNPNISNPGTNFAQGGAQVNTTPGFGAPPTTTAMSVHQQVDTLLAANGGTLDSGALYSVWGGANDVFYQFQFAATLSLAATAAAQGDFDTARLYAGAAQLQATATNGPLAANMVAVATAVMDAAQADNAAGVITAAGGGSGVAQAAVNRAAVDMVGEIARLKAAGARYIIVPNLPPMGDTPGAAQGADPASQAASRASLNSLSSLFNTTLAAGLQQAGIEVIGLNVHGITREIMADPARFGLSNVTSPACNPAITTSSLICTPEALISPEAAQTYFFADGAHPTGVVHAMLADYAESVIEGPQQMAQLPLAGLQGAYAQRQLLAERLQLLRRTPVAQTGQLFMDARLASAEQNAYAGSVDSSGNSSSVSVGGERPLGERGWLGFTVSGTTGSQDFGGNRGSFDLTDVGFTVYGGWNQDAWFAQGYAQLGMQEYGNITRRVEIGPAVYNQQSDTRGTRAGFGVDGGYVMTLAGLRTGPVAGVHFHKVEVQNFHEQAADSVAMSFGDQSLDSLQLRLGWQVSGNLQLAGQSWEPFAELAWVSEQGQDEREVRGGLTSLGTQFSMPVEAMDGSGLEYRLGLQGRLGSWDTSVSVNGSSSMEAGSWTQFGLNIGRSF